MRRFLSFGSFLTVSMWLTQAAAHPHDIAASVDESPSVHVEFTCSRSDVTFHVLDGETVLASCIHDCSLDLEPGRYTVRVEEGADTLAGERTVRVSEAREVRIAPEMKGKKTTGLALAVPGTIVAGVGLVLVMTAWSAGICGGESCSRRQEEPGYEERARRNERFAYVGGGMLLAGGILATVGWVRFGDSKKPDLVGSARRTRPMQVGAGLSPIARGGILSGRVSF